MITRKCLCPTCHATAEKGSYCAVHAKERMTAATRKPFYSAKRSSEGFYNTSRWRTLRRKQLEKQPYCALCGSEIDLSVDHIQNADGNEELFFDENNLQTLCRTCHSQKTHAENFFRRHSLFFKMPTEDKFPCQARE